MLVVLRWVHCRRAGIILVLVEKRQPGDVGPLVQLANLPLSHLLPPSSRRTAELGTRKPNAEGGKSPCARALQGAGIGRIPLCNGFCEKHARHDMMQHATNSRWGFLTASL